MIASALGLVMLVTSHQAATPPAPAKVTLQRTFKAGQKLTYKFASELIAEQRGFELTTYLPISQGYEYTFTNQVVSVSPDGIAQCIYKRPTMTFILGETWDHDEKRVPIKMDMNLSMQVSPINEILGIKDLSPKKPEKKKTPDEDSNLFMAHASPRSQSEFVGQFTNELYRIAMFVGSFDTTLDFAPKLPIRDAKVGDTWKITVGFAPQRVAGSKNKENAVQRLDFTYRYDGLMESEGKKVQRVSASFALETDAAEYVHQVTGLKPSDTGIKSLNIKMNSAVKFDLEPETLTTLRADAHSEGTYAFHAAAVKEQAYEDGKFKADAKLRLVDRR